LAVDNYQRIERFRKCRSCKLLNRAAIDAQNLARSFGRIQEYDLVSTLGQLHGEITDGALRRPQRLSKWSGGVIVPGDGIENENPVAVDIPGRDRKWTRSRGEGLGSSERAVAVAQRDAHVGGAIVCGSKIEPAVAVEVAKRDGTRVDVDRHIRFVQEGTVTV